MHSQGRQPWYQNFHIKLPVGEVALYELFFFPFLFSFFSPRQPPITRTESPETWICSVQTGTSKSQLSTPRVGSFQPYCLHSRNSAFCSISTTSTFASVDATSQLNFPPYSTFLYVHPSHLRIQGLYSSQIQNLQVLVSIHTLAQLQLYLVYRVVATWASSITGRDHLWRLLLTQKVPSTFESYTPGWQFLVTEC